MMGAALISWLVVGGLSVILAMAVGLAGSWLALLDPLLHPAFEIECALDQLTYEVIWPDEPDNLGIRCMQLDGLEPVEPGEPSSALHIGDWFGEDIVHGVRSYHSGSAFLLGHTHAVPRGFVQMLTPGTLRNTGYAVEIDLTLAAGNWTHPERLSISGWWNQEWVPDAH